MSDTGILLLFALCLGVPLVACVCLLGVMIAKYGKSNEILVNVISKEFESRSTWNTKSVEVQKDMVQWNGELADESDRSYGRLDYVDEEIEQ